MENKDQAYQNNPTAQSPRVDSRPQPDYAQQPVIRSSSNSALTTGLVVLIVALLFMMLMFTMNGNNLFKKSVKEDVTQLQVRNAQLLAETNAARQEQGLPSLPEGASSARSMADRLQRDAISLAALTNQWEQELTRKDEQMRKLETDLSTHVHNAQQLYGQISSLQKQLAEAGNDGAALIQLRNDLQIAENQAAMLRKQLADYQSRPSSDEVEMLNKQLSASIANVRDLEQQLNESLNSNANSVDHSKYNDIAEELEKLRPMVNTQRYEIQQLRAQLDSKLLYVDSYKDLPANAATLFERLSSLEGTNSQQLVTAYQTIDSELNARIVHRQTFTEGSAQVPFAREALISEAIQQGQGVKNFYLVVGYASKTGNSAGNRKLSAKRATTVASMVNLIKENGQQVKAVYLGETARFSDTDNSANQICEIWEIKQ